MTNQFKQKIQELIIPAGITINGSNPWDIHVHDERFYARVWSEGSLGLGESYMDGWWDCAAIDQCVDRIFRARLDQSIKPDFKIALTYLRARLFNQQTPKRSYIVGEKHYDIGNDLYLNMLDKRLAYSCGYWKNAHNLDEAEEQKLDLICRKLNLQPGQKILDIGCGWGSFAKFAAETYGVSVVGVTISREQAAFARESCKGLPVEIRLEDYRLLDEPFDHIVSVGMFEHVGYKNYRTFMQVAARCLKDNGLFLLHTIGGNKSVTSTDPWIEKYIFANSMLPSIVQIGHSIEKLFVMEDWHNFGADYDKTLMAWHKNFNERWPLLKANYDERFFRMWNFYLLCCAGSFRSRTNQLWQIVLSKKGVAGVYQTVR